MLLLAEAGTASSQSLSDALRCVDSGPARPRVGLYSLIVDDSSRSCVAPEKDSDGTLTPCLRVGSAFVGEARGALERRLGSPLRTLPSRSPDRPIAVYRVFGDSTAAAAAFYVIEYETPASEQLVFSVQLTGQPTRSGHEFSCIALGDSSAQILRQLGRPADSAQVNVNQSSVKATAWYYDLPFSFELVGGTVYSVRVWRPDDVPARKRTLSRIRDP